MAQKITVVLEDDLDGGPASETVLFSLDGVAYEIDLNDGNAAGLRDAMAPYVGAGRRTGGRSASGGGHGTGGGGRGGGGAGRGRSARASTLGSPEARPWRRPRRRFARRTAAGPTVQTTIAEAVLTREAPPGRGGLHNMDKLKG